MIKISKILKGSFRITSGYGNRTHPVTKVVSHHNGVDLNTPTGTPVYAPFDGVISDAYNHETGGITCIFNEKNGIQLRMAHLNSTRGKGQSVAKGDEICHTGNTGRSTAPHLHLGVRVNGKEVDPTTVIDFNS